MHDDDIKEVSPVFSNHVRHSSIPARKKDKQLVTEQFPPGVCQSGQRQLTLTQIRRGCW